MLHETIKLSVSGSQDYARLVTYIQEYSDQIAIEERPLIVLCPGGGYGHTSDREAEPVAFKFLAMGYHVAILRYSVAPAKYPTALLELASAVKLIREKAAEWHVDTNKILVQGCSAGGHLAASYGCFWKEDFIAKELGLKDSEILKPNGMILCYPVITSGEFAHRGSFECLLGEREAELGAKMSLENQVTSDTPKAFIWHTFEDGAVPVENSLFMAMAMRKANVPCELHIYPRGGHGLSLANKLTLGQSRKENQPECETWIDLAHTWVENL